MFSMLSKRLTSSSLAPLLLAATMCGQLRAAELGEIRVNSYMGQQLSADIELVDLTPADLADLQVRLANPDVFKEAGLDTPPEMAGLYLSIARRDNKRFLHLTTLQAVNAEALHLFLQLDSGGRQIIRAASLWLMPEPPAQRAARAAAPVPVLAPLAASPAPADGGEAGLNEAAQRAFAYRKEKALAQAQAAGQASPAPAPIAAAKTEPENHAAAQPKPLAKPANSGAARAKALASAPSCAAAQQVQDELRQCQAMTSKLADIEGKVRGLQKALAGPAVAASATPVPSVVELKPEPAPAKPAAVPAKAASAPGKPGAMPVKPAVAADLAGNPRKRLTMIIGGALAGLAALGGLIYYLRKRQAKGPLKIWQSFRRKSDADVPILEEIEEVAAQ